MNQRDIIVVGASAGGITALKQLVAALPKDFRGSIFIVLHIPAYTQSALPKILSKAGPIEAVHAQDGEAIESGKIYVARSDHHLLLDEHKVLVKNGPKENRFRPSIDALFRSAAYVHKQRVTGIILSGMLNDGASGLWTIQQLGGRTMVQDPEDAEQPQLPLNVMEYVKPDHTAKASEMAAILMEIMKDAPEEKFKLSKAELDRLEMEVIIATRDNAFEMGIIDLGELTAYTCPECNGALVRLVEGNLLRYRCHTGHAYTASSLLAEVTESIETKLWQSMRGMEEMNILLRNISEHYEHFNQPESAALFRQKAKEGAETARIIHDSVLRQNQYSEDLRHNREKTSDDS